MSSYHLPTSRSFITSLLDSLPRSDSTSPSSIPSNPFPTASPSTRSLFLTIHCLFPTELLPALDLLDRGLLTRRMYRPTAVTDLSVDGALATDAGPVQESSDSPLAIAVEGITVYYVRSAQPARSTTRYQNTAGNAMSYEVRLSAWNCTCAAFSFSAFSGLGWGGLRLEDAELSGAGEGKAWFGGSLRGQDSIPICKHLLACVLVERCGTLAGFTEEKITTREEAAAWGAGWGG